MDKPLRLVILITGLIFGSTSLQAQLSIVFEQTPTGVTCTYSGSLNKANYDLAIGTSGTMGMSADYAVFTNTTVQGISAYRYYLITGPTAFGTGGTAVPDSSTNNNVYFQILGKSHFFFLSSNYTTGNAITGSMTWNNATFLTLGLTSGTYTYTFGNQTAAETISINIPTVVPEPATCASFTALGALALATFLRRRR